MHDILGLRTERKVKERGRDDLKHPRLEGAEGSGNFPGWVL